MYRKMNNMKTVRASITILLSIILFLAPLGFAYAEDAMELPGDGEEAEPEEIDVELEELPEAVTEPEEQEEPEEIEPRAPELPE